jgi:hypothetical protein
MKYVMASAVFWGTARDRLRSHIRSNSPEQQRLFFVVMMRQQFTLAAASVIEVITGFWRRFRVRAPDFAPVLVVLLRMRSSSLSLTPCTHRARLTRSVGGSTRRYSMYQKGM